MKRSSEAALLAGLRISVAMGIVVLLVAGSGLVSANLLAEAAWLDPDALNGHQQVGILTLVLLVGLGGFSGVMLFVSRAERLRYDQASVAMALEEFSVLRQSNLRLIADASSGDLERVGVHAERGEESVRT